MKKIRASFIAIVASLAITVGLSAISSTPAQAATDLGGVSMWNACVDQWVAPTNVVLVGKDVMSWRCYK